MRIGYVRRIVLEFLVDYGMCIVYTFKAEFSQHAQSLGIDV